MPSHNAAASIDASPPGKAASEDGDPDCTIARTAMSHGTWPYAFEVPDITPCQAAWRAAKDFALQGFAHSKPEDFDRSKLEDAHQFKRAFLEGLDKDPAPGSRWRSYSAFELRGRTVTLLPPEAYVQTRQYNIDDGDKPRHFRPLDVGVVTSEALHELIRFNLSVATLTNQALFRLDRILIGVHMISYRMEGGELSFSSPVWMHMDQEEYVSVVLYALSHNVNGGENIFAKDKRTAEAKVTLSEEFESLLLSKSGFHMVVPMNSKDGRAAHRDVILITLSPSTTAQ